MRTAVRKTIVALIILLLLLPIYAIAGEEKIVIAEGEASLGDDTTPAQTRAMALNNARRNALEQAVGVRIHGSTVIYNNELVSDLVQVATRGLIVKEKITKDWTELKGDLVTYYYRIKAHVKPINIERRGNFKILKAEIFRADRKTGSKLPVFQHGDEIQISAKVNEDSYMNIFSVDQDGRIGKLLPNDYFKEEVLNANKVFVFPDDTQRALGFKFRVKTPKKQGKAVESILIIATKKKVDFLSDENIEEPTITDLMQELSKLDPSLWAEKTVGYEVSR